MAALVLAACAGAPGVPTGPDGRPDPVLQQGFEVFSGQCAQCHGSQGQGGRGKKLNDGRAVERYPNASEMVEVVVNGLNAGMPAFRDELDIGEVDAVVRYVREVLS